MDDDVLPVGFGSDLDDEDRRLLATVMAITMPPDPRVAAFERRVAEKQREWEALLDWVFRLGAMDRPEAS